MGISQWSSRLLSPRMSVIDLLDGIISMRPMVFTLTVTSLRLYEQGHYFEGVPPAGGDEVEALAYFVDGA